ncbi:hypothetical protein JOD52_003244 [Brachybacterium muris]|uniref:DUF6049 family protein n=1 Tax=Brachybacterium muris TaxID=219301 RepID=UPI00195A6BD1|nr:DUF6049 family protein [Brachybacterium muris]MBM7502404.1 hypothetical protein [Brachybacterium muris]
MLSSPLPVRPALVALSAVLLTLLLVAAPALVNGPATALAMGSGTVSARPAAPAAPPQPAPDAPVALDLESLTPTSLGADGTVAAEVTVTNTSSEHIASPQLALRTRISRVTERQAVAAWQARTEVDATGDPVATSAASTDLAPGESVTLAVSASADQLGYVDAPYYWGTRRISLTVVSGQEQLASLYTFVVWRPSGATDTIRQSVVLPVATLDPSAPITAPDAFAEAVESGRIADLVDLAVRTDVDWWLDPALLDPPRIPVGSTAEDGAPATEPPAEGGDATAAPTVPEYEPHPVAAPLASTLAEQVGDRTVLAMPYAHADRVALQAAGTTTLSTAVTEAGQRAWGDAGITPAGNALSVPAQQADAQTLQDAADAGATTLMVPSSALRGSAPGTVTPSSVGSLATDAGPIPVLAPDPELSAEFSLLTGSTDTERTRQRMLAETATIASEYTTAPRHVLIAPDPGAALDAQATGSVLDAFADAPWITAGRTGDLMGATGSGDWTTDPQDETGALLTLGEIDPEAVTPTAPDEIGLYQPLAEAEPTPLTSPAVLEDLAGSWEQLDRLGAAMDDDAALDAPRLMALSGASLRWRGMAGVPAERARETGNEVGLLMDRIHVVPASGYNLISDSAGVPITLTNELDTPITVRTALSSDRPLVRIDQDQPEVTVPARGETEIAVPVDAIANGTVQLTVGLTTPDGRPLTEPIEVPLTVNPAWENWTTLLLVIGMGLLVVVGVIRARRTGASTRAPAVQGPEDPVELSRTGLSRPAPPDPGPHEPAQQNRRTQTDPQEERA